MFKLFCAFFYILRLFYIDLNNQNNLLRSINTRESLSDPNRLASNRIQARRYHMFLVTCSNLDWENQDPRAFKVFGRLRANLGMERPGIGIPCARKTTLSILSKFQFSWTMVAYGGDVVNRRGEIYKSYHHHCQALTCLALGSPFFAAASL